MLIVHLDSSGDSFNFLDSYALLLLLNSFVFHMKSILYGTEIEADIPRYRTDDI